MTDYNPFATHFSETRDRPWPEFEMLLPHMHKQDKLLDMGCGNGRLRASLGHDMIREGDYFGFDMSAELLKVARERYPTDHFFRGDFSEIWPFGDDNFEVVTAIASFHHLLSKRDQLHFLREAKRVLRPGGILFLTTWKIPDKYFWPNVLRGRWNNWLVPFGPEKHPRIYRRVNDGQLKKLLKKAGFEILSSELFEDRNYVAIGRKCS